MKNGKLYVVPTPIGNLKDITLRALEVLGEMDLIAAEDTRQTLKLLNHFSIKKPLISYHKHNEYNKTNIIIDKLREGQKIALVSDAGTPGISDPGAVIIQKCIQENIDIEVLPGACAATTALVYSGLNTDKFMFCGFIPRENKERKKLIADIKMRTETLIFYESPHRILDSLSFLRESLGNRKIAACRELTKLYEEVARGSIEEVIELFKTRVIKGEFVLVLQGKSEEEIVEEKKQQWDHLTIEQHISKYIDEGLSKKDAIKKVAKDRNSSKSDIYKWSINLQ